MCVIVLLHNAPWLGRAGPNPVKATDFNTAVRFDQISFHNDSVTMKLFGENFDKDIIFTGTECTTMSLQPQNESQLQPDSVDSRAQSAVYLLD